LVSEEDLTLSEPVVETNLIKPESAITPSITKIENKEIVRKSLSNMLEKWDEEIKIVIKVIISKRIILKSMLEELSKKIKLIRKNDIIDIAKVSGRAP
jgi:hypothetical protein